MIKSQEWMKKSGFCDRMREARERAGMTMLDVSNSLGTTLSYAYKVEKAETCPSIARCCEMARLYGVSIDWLCGRVKR